MARKANNKTRLKLSYPISGNIQSCRNLATVIRKFPIYTFVLGFLFSRARVLS
mgnify:CR=1 FL=1